jgi:hypothetical protein
MPWTLIISALLSRAAAVSQALLIQWCYWSPSCSELCSQVRRQGLTSPNDRFYGPSFTIFLSWLQHFFFFFVLFVSLHFLLFPPSSFLILAFVNKKKESKESRKYGDDNVVHNKVSTRARANVSPPPLF